MPHDDPNRPEWQGKSKVKNWKHINSACKLAKLSDGKAPMPCPKCGTVHKLKNCPFCGCPRGRSSGGGAPGLMSSREECP